MKKPTFDESDIQDTNGRDQLSRRGLIKGSAIASAGILLSASGLALSGAYGCKPKWQGTDFGKLLLHNFELFDGLQNPIRRIHLTGDKQTPGVKDTELWFDAHCLDRQCIEPVS